MKPAILIVGAILLVIGGIALFDMVQAFGSSNACIAEHGYDNDKCGPVTASAGSTAILCNPIFIIFFLAGMVLLGDGLK